MQTSYYPDWSMIRVTFAQFHLFAVSVLGVYRCSRWIFIVVRFRPYVCGRATQSFCLIITENMRRSGPKKNWLSLLKTDQTKVIIVCLQSLFYAAFISKENTTNETVILVPGSYKCWPFQYFPLFSYLHLSQVRSGNCNRTMRSNIKNRSRVIVSSFF